MTAAGVRRIHQEDMCQVLGVDPRVKYQSDGGPTPEQTDARAENYSLLIGPGQVRLAPLYDVASILPYEDVYVPRLKLAMRIGGEYRVDAIGGRHWRRFAELNRLDPGRTIERVDALAVALPACRLPQGGGRDGWRCRWVAAAAGGVGRRARRPLPHGVRAG